MKMYKHSMLIILVFISLLYSGCWNYKEVDELAVVAGVAVDKDNNNKYIITAEVVDISGGREIKTKPKLITMDGKTLFDAVRNMISITGKKLYWSHSKVIIVSKKVASDGLIKVLDWYNRDAETRPDVFMLISEEESAKQILESQSQEDINSFSLEDTLKSQEKLSKAPITDVLQFDNDLIADGISATAPTVGLKQVNGKDIPSITGTAIFKKDKLIGFLNSEETKTLLFIKNKIKGGVITISPCNDDIPIPVSLEIFKNTTKVTPIVEDNQIKFSLKIDTSVAIDEIEGSANFIEDQGRNKLQKKAEGLLKERAETLIEKIQAMYAVDIFGFGVKLRQSNNKMWNHISSNWQELFSKLEVNVITKINIRNSAMLSKPLEVGD